MEKEMRSKRVIVLSAATTVSFVSGLLYMWSVVSKALVKELHWTSTQASLPYTVALVAFVLAMIPGGRLQDVKGPRITATVGGILLGLGLILSGFVTDPIIMIVTFGIIAGSGIGINNVSAMPPALKWYPPEKYGMISGIVVAGVGLSSVLYSPLTNALAANFGISKTFIFLGIGALISGVFLAQFLNNPPEGYTPLSVSSSSQKTETVLKTVEGFTSKEIIRKASFYKVWVMFAFSASAGLMIIGHIAVIAVKQANWENGFLLVILLALFNAIGRFGGGTLSDRFGRITILRAAFFIQALNMLFFSQYTSSLTLAVGVMLTGACYGASFAVFPAITADLFGFKNMGMNYGMVLTGWGLGGVIGPMTAAKIVDMTGNYHTAYIVAFVLLVIAILVSFVPLKNR